MTASLYRGFLNRSIDGGTASQFVGKPAVLPGGGAGAGAGAGAGGAGAGAGGGAGGGKFMEEEDEEEEAKVLGGDRSASQPNSRVQVVKHGA